MKQKNNRIIHGLEKNTLLQRVSKRFARASLKMTALAACFALGAFANNANAQQQPFDSLYPYINNEYSWDFDNNWIYLKLNYQRTGGDIVMNEGLLANGVIEIKDGNTSLSKVTLGLAILGTMGVLTHNSGILPDYYENNNNAWVALGPTSFVTQSSARYWTYPSPIDHVRMYYMELRFPIPSSYYGNNLSFNWQGTWARASELDFSDILPSVLYVYTPFDTTITVHIATFNPINLTSSFNVDNNAASVRLPWNISNYSTGINHDHYGKIYLYDGTVKKDSVNPAASGTFRIAPDATYLNSKHTYSVAHEYSIQPLHNKADTIIVPAYPQASNFDASFNANTRKVTLSWNAAAVSGTAGTDYLSGDYFEIQRATNSAFTANLTTLSTSATTATAYNNTKTSYTFEDNFTTQEVNQTYYYRIRRTHTSGSWGWTYFVSTDNAAVNTQHVKVGSISAVLDNGNPNRAIITWTLTGGSQWTSGSQFILKQTNLSTAADKTLISTTNLSEAQALTYTDDPILLCNRYRYSIDIIPGSTSYTHEPVQISSEVIPVVIGSVVSLLADKGYNPDRTILQWTTQGGFDNCYIDRKVYGAHDSTYLSIASVAFLTTQDRYNYEDMQGYPGVIYQYRVRGAINCAGSVYFSNAQTDVGFRRPVGMASGHISYGTGTAVPGARVVAEPLNEGDAANARKSVYFNGSATSYMLINNTTKVLGGQEFSFQAWINPQTKQNATIFSTDNNQVSLKYTSLNTMEFKTPAATLTFVDTFAQLNQYSQLTAVYAGNKMQVYINGILCQTTTFSQQSYTAQSTDNVKIGTNFRGNIDEIRFWGRSLDSAAIAENMGMYLIGNESSFRAYYRFEEAIPSAVYDMSFTGNDNYNRNNAQLVNAVLTDSIPNQSQLSVSGITDVNGNYIIGAIPYAGTGTTYRFVPMFDVHTFNPTNKVRMISANTPVQSDIDFEDVSSFQVSGTILYAGTSVPVSGVSFVVDGSNPCMKDGRLIETDANGQYTIEVPIGWHFITAQKSGHILAALRGVNGYIANNRFPADSVARYDFQATEELNFTDSTRVELVGRFTGGPVEAKKPVGFGLSKNNLGVAELTFSLVKNGMTNLNTTDVVETHVSSSGRLTNTQTYTRQSNQVKVTTNPQTGEFVAWLIPEDHQVNVLNNSTIVSSTNPAHSVTYSGIISMKTQTETGYLYDSDTSTVAIDEGNKQITDTIYYHQKLDLIYRASPTIEVLNASTSDTIFGDTLHVITDDLGNKDTLNLVENRQYATGLPVFTHQGTYAFDISVFEQYDNRDGNPVVVDRVPTVDGTVIANTDMVTGNYPTEAALDQNGKAQITFMIDAPNVTYNSNDPSQSYTKNFNFQVNFSDGTPSKQWNPVNRNAYVFGAKSDGNNFVTKGPKRVTIVLRDPPGSNSYAWVEKGSVINSTHSWGARFGNTTGITTKFAYGVDLETFAGIGAGLIISSEVKNDYTVGLNTAHAGGWDNSSSTVTTITKTISTSAEPDYVGPDADVFVGAAYNIIFGEAKMIGVIDENNVTDPVGSVLTSRSGKNYMVGSERGMFLVPEFETDFYFTRKHIVDNVIPNLEKIRNTMLTYDPSMPTSGNLTNSPVYISILPPDDPNFGKSNRDTKAFGQAATTFARRYDIGDSAVLKTPSLVNSYYILNPDSWAIDSLATDSLQFYNTDIDAWKQVLANDEKQMLEAAKLKNISFDAGAIYEESSATETTHSYTNVYEGSANLVGALNTGATFNATGVFFTIEEEVNSSFYDNETEENTTSVTYGYHLEDGDPSDYHTVDIKKPSTPYATAFKLLGGQTSCPYEGEITAQYYETTGSAGILQQGTSMVQDPYMSINTNFIGNVPGNRSANFSLLVGNGSLVSDAWYMLTVDEKTNPDGLILEVDGLPIGNGRVFAFDPTEAFNKTLSVRRTRQDVTEYNDIRLVLASTCQDDLFDELWISVHFLPACSDLVLDRPVSNQILNILSGDSAQFIVNQYDVNYLNFDHIVLEYKPATQNAYIPFGYYYKDSAAYKNASTVPDDQKQVIDNNATDLRQWWKAPVQDGFYLLRARSVCPAGAALSYESISDEVQVVKDMISPIVFGTPQPADGILAVDDNLLIDFNEAIQPDYTYRISVQGELNGEELLHNAGLQFDGVNDVVEINQPLNLEGKSFTVEMWTLRDNSNPHNAVLFSHGTQDSKFELGVDASHKLWVRIDEDSVSAVMPVQDITNSWTHIAAVFDNEQNNISVYVNGNAATNAGGIPSHITSVEYAATGIITVGGDFDKMNCYNGKMNELRLWTKALSSTKLYEQMSKKLSGTEAGLAGYWQMNEARGTLVSDRIRGRNGVTTAQWYALPVGRSLSFNGNGYAKTSITEIGPEADFSLEFWFRADSLNSNACLFSTGRGDNGDEIQSGNQLNDKFSIYFDASQNLVLRSSGKTAAIASNLADNDWHHFAMSVSRRGNANIYIDANLQTSLYAADYFGSFKASKLYLGAMGWEKNFTTDTVAYFFRGNIDELRIWKAMLTREGIRIASSSRLNGDEAGLRAYYPFDTTETVTLIHPTLCDQMDTSRIDNGEEARRNEAFVLYSGASSSVLAANITPARRLQNVPFERVYNENQIYLNLTAPMSSIENCVLEISVSDVKDMHGNIIVNPVKWTAFIDRNYLKWGEEHFSFVKNVFDPLSFTVEVINRSGLEQTFNIENMPAWLSVSPSSGTISPAGKITVRFTVDEGLNAGIYDENIYLRNSNGFNELLAIDLRVLGSKPEWEVDASQYNYSMNIFGELNINGIVSTDPEDMLAAFAGNTCVGIANLRYVDQYDRHLAFLNVYGNTGGTPLHFKIWDASAGIIYTMITPDTLVFAENSYYGTAKTPITFRAINYIEQHIPLAQGWNWISKNVSTPAMTSINATFVNNSFASGDLLKSQFNGFDQYSNNSWIGNISLAGGMNNTQMYMLKVETDKTLILAGEAVDPTTETITIYPGWTWTGFTPQINLSTQEAFVGADPQDGNIVKNQTSFSIYYEGIGWIGTLNYLSPGKGYIYYSTAQDTVEFTYPTVSSLTSNRKSMPQHGSTVNSAVEVPGQYSDNLSIIGSLQADGIDMSRTQILCYAGDEYRGAGVPVYVEDKDEWIYFITAGGESNGDVLSFRLKTANGETIGLKERLQFGTNRLYGTVDRPMVFSLGSEDAVLTAYPVPFSSELTLAFTLDDASKGQVSFTLTDVMGSRLLSIERTYSQAGYYTLSLNREISSLSAGVYFIGMTTSTGKHTVKTVKIK